MMTFIIIVHAMTCAFLVIVILMQSGRGGGLTEQFASAESVFGAKTNVVMVRITSVLATIFIVTSCTLAFLSAKKEESLMSRMKATNAATNNVINIPIPADSVPNVESIQKAVAQPAAEVAPATPKQEVVPADVSSQPATAVSEPAK